MSAPFRRAYGEGTLLVATDGLWKYAGPEAICRVVRENDLRAAAKGLVDLVRLRSGALPDDVTVALCRLPGTSESVKTDEAGPGRRRRFPHFLWGAGITGQSL